MTRYLSVLLSVLVLTLFVNAPTTYATDQPELTRKEKRIIKRIARKVADKRAQKTINAILPLGPDDLATGAVTTPKLANEAVNATKITNGAVGTAEIADGSVTLSKLSVGCPAGTAPMLGKCFETALRASLNFFDATKICEALGARLPTVGELYSTLPNKLAGDNTGEHTDTVQSTLDTVRVRDIIPTTLDFQPTLTVAAFRCVFDPFQS